MTWADIPGFPGYQANTSGQIKRLERADKLGRRLRERILAGHVNEHNYRKYCIGGSQVSEHTLVLLAFVGPRPPGKECCHNNGDRLDNRLENLRWDTRQANTLDKIAHGNHPFASRDRCKNGHLYTPENTSMITARPIGKPVYTYRQCKACGRRKSAAFKERRHSHADTK